MNNGSTNLSEGAPIAISSLIACEVKPYPGYRIPPATSVATYSSEESAPHTSKNLRSIVSPNVLTSSLLRHAGFKARDDMAVPRSFVGGRRNEHGTMGRADHRL